MVLRTNTTVLLIAIIIISGLSLATYSLFQSQAEGTIKASIFEREKELQAKRAEQLASRMGSDLQLLMTKLEVLANSAPAQSGDFSSPEMDTLLKRIFDESNTISPIEGTGISNSKNIVMNVYQPEIEKSRLIGQDMSSRPFAIEARNNFPNPTFSSGFETMINSEGQRMALLYPIINEEGQHIGWARSAVDASSFFAKYGNIRDIGSEYFVVLDKKGTILVHPITQLEGKNNFGPEVREQLGIDEQRDLHYQKALAGQDALTTIVGINGPRERINTGHSIQTGAADEPIYFLFLITPTSSINSEINDVLFTTRLQNSLLVAAIIGALVALAISIIRWNRSLKHEVEHKTSELADSNKALSKAVKSLEDRDETQKQFINIAAHELRTPIQPLLGMADILEAQFGGDVKNKIEVTKPEIDMIIRNARRLERLSSDILEVARIESHSLTLSKEKFDLVGVIKEAVRNTQNFLKNRESMDGDRVKKNIQLRLEPELELQGDKIIIEGDRGRITEVIDNILANAIKFIDSGGIITIKLRLEKQSSRETIVDKRNDFAMVSVRDTGIGIDNEIMSRLFTKFVTKSEQGTGLGLFISRNIVEGHGGKIWAENNQEGKGATFTFTLPIAKNL